MGYATAGEVGRALTDLESLHAIAQARAEAGYERGERMPEMLLMGAWWLDSCGNLLLLDAPITAVGRVMSRGALEKAGVTTWLASIYGIHRVPTSTTRCDVCGNGWVLETAHDVVAPDSNDPADTLWYHQACYRLHCEQRELAWAVQVMTQAGFTGVEAEAIHNQYCPCLYCPPWVRLSTEQGPLTLGKRKRVYEVHWEGKDLTRELADYEPTKGAYMAHVWRGNEIEFLRQLRGWL